MTALDENKSFWGKIQSLGGGGKSSENLIIRLMNQMAFMGTIVCFCMGIVGFLLGIETIYNILAFVLAGIQVMLLVLNSLNRFPISKFIVAGVLPVFISLEIVAIGGSFGEESILTVVLLLIYVLYESSPQKRFRYYLSLAVSYISANIFLYFYPPLFSFIDNPYDNMFAFIVCAVWFLSLLYYYQNKINTQQKAQDGLIEELKIKNTNLEKTTEELEQFTYIASHDLKSPLRTIVSFLDLIKRDIQKEKYDELLSKVDFARSGAEQMNFLVTDILEYSKITSGKERKRSMVSLHSVAEKVKFNLMDLIKEKNVDLYIFPLPDFYCNETEMTILFQNFIENGIKYNEESTPNIFVKSMLNKEELVLQFVDNGIGIEETYFEKIFQFFKRLHTNQIYKGTGLGLGLCKKIIDDMNGTVSVESTINVGSTFTIKLPIQHSKTPLEIANIPAEQNN